MTKRKLLSYNSYTLWKFLEKEAINRVWNPDAVELFDFTTQPFCCGILELGNLQDLSILKDDGIPQRVFPLLLAYQIRKEMDCENAEAVTAATIPATNRLWINVFKKLGFKPLMKTRNPKTENLITLWGYSER